MLNKTFDWMLRSAVRLLNWCGLRPVYLLCRRSALQEEGWFVAWRANQCVDAQGNPIPWIAYPAKDFIEGRVRKDMRVFEYGAGNSTLWWAARTATVTSVEHDAAWYRRIAALVPANARVMHRSLEQPEAYASAILESGEKFDVVFIDGRHRALCLQYCQSALSEGGVIVLDNSERSEYAQAVEETLRQGFRKIDFQGMFPLIAYKAQTTVFYRDKNIFGI